MKIQMKRALLILAFGIPAFACADETVAPSNAPQADEAPVVAKDNVKDRVKVTVTGTVDFAADKGKTIYAEFVSSDKGTRALKEALSAAGYTLAASRDEANLVYVVDGAFQALRPTTQRTAEMRAGEYVENPAPPKTKSGHGPTLKVGGLFTMIVGTVLENAATYSGARDAINLAASGDPDGACLANCDGWKYQQSSVINFKRIEQGEERKVLVISEVVADELVPAVLFQSSLSGLEVAAGIGFGAILGEAPVKTSSM